MTSPRTPLVAATLLTLVLVGAAARAISSKYEERRRAIAAEAEAQRRKLNLDGDRAKLVAAYPTPELRFSGEPAVLPPGGTTTISLEGKIQAGTKFLLSDDLFTLTEERVTATRYEAKLRAPANALPGGVVLHAISPVSDIDTGQEVARVRGSYDFALAFADGWSAKVNTVTVDEGGAALLEVTWSKAGQKARTVKATASSTAEPFRIEFLPTEDETAVQQETMQKQAEVINAPELQKKQAALFKRLEACGQGAQEKMAACMEKPAAELRGLTEEAQKKNDAIAAAANRKLPQGAPGCQTFYLSATASGVSGTAQCRDGRELAVTGTVKGRPLAP